MASIPDDIDTASPDDCDRAQARIRVTLDQRGVDDLRDDLFHLLDETPHLVLDVRGSRQITGGHSFGVDLVSARTGVVGPALDAVCAFLRERDPDAGIRVPGWQRAFYGWERAIWTSSGRLRPEAIG